jgi:hypothetical protein
MNRLRELEVYNEWNGHSIIYLYRRYEEYLCGERHEEIDTVTWGKIWASASPEQSIEHLFPQGWPPNASWRGKAQKGVKYPGPWVHSLGNLLVVTPGLNAKLLDRSFEEKKRILANDLKGLRTAQEIIKLRDWSFKAIRARESRIIRWAVGKWCESA